MIIFILHPRRNGKFGSDQKVVLSLGICTQLGAIILSRQFIEMSKARLEFLYSNFPRHLKANSQNTFFEFDNVMFLYQPLDCGLYLVLMATCTSNIVLNVQTLQLASRIIPDACSEMTEEDIRECSFEILFAFDEIVSLGLVENITHAQIKNNISMESHDEIVQDMIAPNKEQEAKEAAKLKAKQIEMQKREDAKMRKSSFSYSPVTQMPQIPQVEKEPEYIPQEPRFTGGRGMKLGKKYEKPLDTFPSLSKALPKPKAKVEPSPVPETPRFSHPVGVSIEEHVTLVANRDGRIDQYEVRGDLTLSISDDTLAKLKLVLDHVDQRTVQFKTHPNIEKNNFSSMNEIGLKKPDRPFPVNQSVGVLRYRMLSQEEDSVPFSVNCWPSEGRDGMFEVNIEYQLENENLVLDNVLVFIPMSGNSRPEILSCDGDWTQNTTDHILEWNIGSVSTENSSGTLEFKVQANDLDSFFPINIQFDSETSFCGVNVRQAILVESGESVEFDQKTVVLSEEYSVL